MFNDRKEAGVKLAALLRELPRERSIVYGLPRGGIPVAYEVAKELGYPLEALIVRKIGTPGQEELALGAVAEGEPPAVYYNRELMDYLGLTREFVEPALKKKEREIAEIQYLYREGKHMLVDPESTAIIVDDGIATGATVKAAIIALKAMGQKRIILAVPVAQSSIIRELETMVESVVCVETVGTMYAVGEFFQDFSQVTHETVRQMLLNSMERIRAAGK